MKLTRDNRLGYGLLGEAGISILSGKWDISLEARYHYGFSDLLRPSSKYTGNPIRSPIDQFTISATVFYRLGKDTELRAPISKGLDMRIAEAQARRVLEQQMVQVLRDSLALPTPSLDSLSAEEQMGIDSLTRVAMLSELQAADSLTRDSLSSQLDSLRSLSPELLLDHRSRRKEERRLLKLAQKPIKPAKEPKRAKDSIDSLQLDSVLLDLVQLDSIPMPEQELEPTAQEKEPAPEAEVSSATSPSEGRRQRPKRAASPQSAEALPPETETEQ